MFSDDLEGKIKLPIIHIVTETAKAVKQKGLVKLGLLGTKFTLKWRFIEKNRKKMV